jgi:hypothetical protein
MPDQNLTETVELDIGLGQSTKEIQYINMLTLTRIEPCESWGKYILEIWDNTKWVHVHTDYLCIVKKMQKTIEDSFDKRLREKWII